MQIIKRLHMRNVELFGLRDMEGKVVEIKVVFGKNTGIKMLDGWVCAFAKAILE